MGVWGFDLSGNAARRRFSRILEYWSAWVILGLACGSCVDSLGRMPGQWKIKKKKSSKKTTKTLHNKDCRSVLAQCLRTPIPFPISHCYGEHRAKYQRAISSSWRTAAFSFYVSAVKNTFCVYYFSFLFSFALTWHCIMLRGRGSIKIQGGATAILSEARAWYARWAGCVINYTYICF